MSQSHTVTLPVGLGLFALLLTPIAQQAAIAYSAIALGVVFLILAFVSQAKQQQHRTLKLQALEQLVEKSQLDNQKLLTTTQTSQATVEEMLQQFLPSYQQQAVSNAEKINQTLEQLVNGVNDGNQVRETLTMALITDTRNLAADVSAILDEMQAGFDRLDETITQLDNTTRDSIEDLRDSMDDTTSKISDRISSVIEQTKEADEALVGNLTAAFNDVCAELQQTATMFETNVVAQTAATTEQANQLQPIIQTTQATTEQLVSHTTDFSMKLTEQLQQLMIMNRQLIDATTELADSKSAERKRLLNVQKKLLETFS